MVKEPRPGRVKTRLGRTIGMTTAAWWFRHQLRNTLRRLDDPRWQLVLAVSPDAEGLQSRIWPRHLPRIPQGGGDLGARMAGVFRNSGIGPTLIIGADIPAVSPANIQRAFDALGANASVLGPAPDGGYWLVGLLHPNRLPTNLFVNVRWSTQFALSDTLPTLPGPVALVDTLADIDTIGDLKTLH